MVYSKYSGSGKFDKQQLIIMDQKEKEKERQKNEVEQLQETKTEKNEDSTND